MHKVRRGEIYTQLVVTPVAPSSNPPPPPNARFARAPQYLRSKSRRRQQFSKLFHKMLDGIRYSLTPIHASLVVAQAFTEASLTESVEEIQNAFQTFAVECGEMGTEFLSHVIEGEDWLTKWDEILMKPIGGMTCVEIALDVKLYSFLVHPKVIRFVDTGWMGEGERGEEQDLVRRLLNASNTHARYAHTQCWATASRTPTLWRSFLITRTSALSTDEFRAPGQ